MVLTSKDGNKVGKKYQRLLQEAQKFSMNAGKYTPVNT